MGRDMAREGAVGKPHAYNIEVQCSNGGAYTWTEKAYYICAGKCKRIYCPKCVPEQRAQRGRRGNKRARNEAPGRG